MPSYPVTINGQQRTIESDNPLTPEQVAQYTKQAGVQAMQAAGGQRGMIPMLGKGGPSPIERAQQPGTGILGLPRSTTGAGPLVNAIGDVVIPKTAGQVGMLGGMLALPLLRPIMAATPIVGRVIAHLPAPFQRIIMAGIGDGAAQAVTGGSFTEGMQEGMLGAGVGEAGMAGVGLVGRTAHRGIEMLPGVREKARAATAEAARSAQIQRQVETSAMKTVLAEDRATAARAQVPVVRQEAGQAAVSAADTIGQAAPPLKQFMQQGPEGGWRPGEAPMTAAEELASVRTFPGLARRAVSKAQAVKTQEAVDLVGPDYTVRVPSLAVENPAWQPGGEAFQRVLDAFGPKGTQAVAQAQRVGQLPPGSTQARVAAQVGLKPGDPIPSWLKGASPTQRQFSVKDVMAQLEAEYGPPTKDTFSLHEINQRLEDVGMAGWRGRGDQPNVARAGHGARKVYSTAREEIREAMTGAGATPESQTAFAHWDEGRRWTSITNAVIHMLKGANVFETGVNGAPMDPAAFSQMLRKNAQNLRTRMLPDDYQALIDTGFKGGIYRDLTTPAVSKAIAIAEKRAQIALARAAQADAEVQAARAAGRPISDLTMRAMQGQITADQARQQLAVLKQQVGAPPALQRPWPWPYQLPEIGQMMLDTAVGNLLSSGGGPQRPLEMVKPPAR